MFFGFWWACGWQWRRAVGQEEEGFEVSARSFVIMDAKTGKILLSLNPQVFIPPASTLKVMTALVVVEHLKMDDKVSVSPYAAAAPASKIGIKPGRPTRCRSCSTPSCCPQPTTPPGPWRKR